jgi:poly-gamma-glutamate capsule biosynthesis protein CapA/YwtB (metallophosphatase superfamily)
MKINLWRVSLILTFLLLAACSGNEPDSPAFVSNFPATPRASPPFDGTSTPTQTLDPTSTSSPIPNPQVTVAAVGDIMLARTIGEQIVAKGPQVIFAGVQSALDSADIRIGNLECAITDRESPEKKAYPLKAPVQAAQALSLAGFDILSLANNHSMDYGYAGLADTQTDLRQFDIATVGAGLNDTAAHTPIFLDRNGLRLAFLAYADVVPENTGFDLHSWIATGTRPGIAWADPAMIKSDVSAAKLHADLVIVLLHSGYEINSTPSFNQRAQAHAAIDAGAVLVIGSHPHLLQEIEQYHGGLIAYSLGNFVFDNYFGITNATIILRVVLNRSGVVSHNYTPVLIENGLPVITPIENVRGIETLVAPTKP